MPDLVEAHNARDERDKGVYEELKVRSVFGGVWRIFLQQCLCTRATSASLYAQMSLCLALSLATF